MTSRRIGSIGARFWPAARRWRSPANGARAQSFPSGPVKIVTSVGPGSSPDVCARVLAEQLDAGSGASR